MHMHCSDKGRMSVEKILGFLRVLSTVPLIYFLQEHVSEFTMKINSNI